MFRQEVKYNSSDGFNGLSHIARLRYVYGNYSIDVNQREEKSFIEIGLKIDTLTNCYVTI